MISYENITSVIPNATMQKMYRDGVLAGYTATPNTGYVLHVKGRDTLGYDEETGEYYVIYMGYTRMTSSCTVDLTPVQLNVPLLDNNGNVTTETITAYNLDYEFFAVPENRIPYPDYQIFGGAVTPPHEVM